MAKLHSPDQTFASASFTHVSAPSHEPQVSAIWSESDQARYEAKSFLQRCYNKVVEPCSQACQTDDTWNIIDLQRDLSSTDDCILYRKEIELLKSQYLEVVDERDLLQSKLDLMRKEHAGMKERVKGKLRTIAVYYNTLAHDIQELQLNEHETNQAFRQLVEERDNLATQRQNMKIQLDRLLEENVSPKQRLLKETSARTKDDCDAQISQFKARVLELERDISDAKLNSPVKLPNRPIDLESLAKLRTIIRLDKSTHRGMKASIMP